MKKLLTLMSASLLVSCTNVRYIYRDPPEIPDLPANLKEPCPKLPLLKDKSIFTLENDDNDTSALYAQCRNNNLGLLQAFDLARQTRKQFLEEKTKATEELLSATKKKK